jgi:hypothetical protein
MSVRWLRLLHIACLVSPTPANPPFAMRWTILAIVSLESMLAAAAFGAETPTCGGCGCCEHVRKVCRMVCVTEEVKEIKYGCACEDFCIPGPSKKCGCQEIPVCGEVRTRRKLVKHEVVKKVPKYKCVVEYLCPHCCGAHAPPPVATASLEAAPVSSR